MSNINKFVGAANVSLASTEDSILQIKQNATDVEDIYNAQITSEPKRKRGRPKRSTELYALAHGIYKLEDIMDNDNDNNDENDEDEDKTYTCFDCDKTFKYKFSYTRHMKVYHSGEHRYKCEQCPATFVQLSSVHEHITKSHSTYECKYCVEVFTDFVAFTQHKINAHGIINRKESTDSQDFIRRKCFECKRTFATKYVLQNHVKVVHKRILQYNCTKCPARFGAKLYLQKHTSNVHPDIVDPERSFPCPECVCIYGSPKGLTQHVNKYHRNSSNTLPQNATKISYSVDLSNSERKNLQESIINSTNFNQHQQQRQQSQMAVISYVTATRTTTPKSTPTPSNNNINPIQQFPCRECDKTFTFRSAYELHMTRNHTNKFECTKCYAKFRELIHFQKHNAFSHPILKNSKFLYQCPFCRIKCCAVKNLRHHMKTKHKALQTKNTKISIDETDETSSEFNDSAAPAADGTTVTIASTRITTSTIATAAIATTPITTSITTPITTTTTTTATTARTINNLQNYQFSNQKPYVSDFRNIFECAHCEKKFYEVITLKNHVQRLHSPKPVLNFNKYCEFCLQSFLSKRALISHIRIKHKEVFLLNANEEEKSQINVDSDSEFFDDYNLNINKFNYEADNDNFTQDTQTDNSNDVVYINGDSEEEEAEDKKDEKIKILQMMANETNTMFNMGNVAYDDDVDNEDMKFRTELLDIEETQLIEPNANMSSITVLID